MSRSEIIRLVSSGNKIENPNNVASCFRNNLFPILTDVKSIALASVKIPLKKGSKIRRAEFSNEFFANRSLSLTVTDAEKSYLTNFRLIITDPKNNLSGIGITLHALDRFGSRELRMLTKISQVEYFTNSWDVYGSFSIETEWDWNLVSLGYSGDNFQDVSFRKQKYEFVFDENENMYRVRLKFSLWFRFLLDGKPAEVKDYVINVFPPRYLNYQNLEWYGFVFAAGLKAGQWMIVSNVIDKGTLSIDETVKPPIIKIDDVSYEFLWISPRMEGLRKYLVPTADRVAEIIYVMCDAVHPMKIKSVLSEPCLHLVTVKNEDLQNDYLDIEISAAGFIFRNTTTETIDHITISLLNDNLEPHQFIDNDRTTIVTIFSSNQRNIDKDLFIFSSSDNLQKHDNSSQKFDIENVPPISYESISLVYTSIPLKHYAFETTDPNTHWFELVQHHEKAVPTKLWPSGEKKNDVYMVIWLFGRSVSYQTMLDDISTLPRKIGPPRGYPTLHVWEDFATSVTYSGPKYPRSTILMSDNIVFADYPNPQKITIQGVSVQGFRFLIVVSLVPTVVVTSDVSQVQNAEVLNKIRKEGVNSAHSYSAYYETYFIEDNPCYKENPFEDDDEQIYIHLDEIKPTRIANQNEPILQDILFGRSSVTDPARRIDKWFSLPLTVPLPFKTPFQQILHFSFTDAIGELNKLIDNRRSTICVCHLCRPKILQALTE